MTKRIFTCGKTAIQDHQIVSANDDKNVAEECAKVLVDITANI